MFAIKGVARFFHVLPFLLTNCNVSVKETALPLRDLCELSGFAREQCILNGQDEDKIAALRGN